MKDDFAIFTTGTADRPQPARRVHCKDQRNRVIRRIRSSVASFQPTAFIPLLIPATDTVVATRTYIPGNAIEYQGISRCLIIFPSRGTPSRLSPTLRVWAITRTCFGSSIWERADISGQTFTAAYRDLVAAGSRAHLAELSRDAMGKLNQAQENREAAVVESRRRSCRPDSVSASLSGGGAG